MCEVNRFHDYQSLVTACFIALPPAKILNTVGDLKKSVSAKYAVGSLRGTKTALTLEGLDST